jgi:hypothetical protein
MEAFVWTSILKQLRGGYTSMNLFDCGADRNSNHFTSLRLLRFLLSRRGETSKEGQGYYDLTRLVALMEDIFDNREDTIRALFKTRR